jgi:putative ABC transport system permease protein
VTLTTIAIRNMGRNKFRTALTVLGVVVTMLVFMTIRTVLWSWTASIEQAQSDRVATRHKVSFIMQLPKRYAEEIKEIPGVKQVAYANWFGAKDPKHETEFFATFAVDPEDYLAVYNEMLIDPAQKQAWFENRRGAIVGDAIAKKFGWKIGDRLTLRGTIYPGDWEFQISGIYTAKRATVDRSSLLFHWDYLNESPVMRVKDQVGWIVARIDNPGRSAEISKAIDKKFDERDLQTLSMSEGQLNASFLGSFSAVLKALDIVSLVILVIMTLILGNTIAMGVRERTHEYGVMRAIGFVPRHVLLGVMAESIALGVVGGTLGLLLSYPLVEKGLGRFLEENMGAFFPFFRIDPKLAALAFGLAVMISVLASIIPARQAAGLNVVDSLRRVA